MRNLPWVALATMFLGSCATSSPYDRGSLSDAMEKSRDDYPDEREVPDERDDDAEWWDDDSRDDGRRKQKDAPSSSDTEPARMAMSELHRYAGVRGGAAFASGPYFDHLFDAEIFLAFPEGPAEIQIFGALSGADVKPDSSVADSIEDTVVLLRAGAELRYMPIDTGGFFRPYLAARLGGLYMSWSFQNPLEAGSDTIFSDSVGGIFLGAGLGINLVDLDRFRLGAAVVPEVNLFGSETGEGFDNDVFSHYGTTRWVVESAIGFR